MPTITGLTYPGHRASQVGPFESGGLLYTVGLNGSGALTVFRSSDGSSWTAVASSITLGATHGLTALISGTTLFIGYPNAFITYALDTNIFGAPVDTGQVANADLTGNTPLFMARRSNGHVVFLRQGPALRSMGADYRRVVMDYYNGSTWTTNTNVDGAGSTTGHADAGGLYVDANDRAWLLYSDPTRFGLISIKRLEPTSTVLTTSIAGPSTSISRNYPVSNITEFTHNGLLHTAILAAATDTTYTQFIFSSEPSPVRTSGSTGEGASSAGVRADTGNPGALVNTGDHLLHSFHVHGATGAIHRNKQEVTGATYNPAAEVPFQTATTFGISARYLPSGKVGVVYNDSGTVIYEAHALTAPVVGPTLGLYARGR